VFFTLILPVLFLVIPASIFRDATVKVPGGTMKEPVYSVPAIIAFGLIAAAFSNLRGHQGNARTRPRQLIQPSGRDWRLGRTPTASSRRASPATRVACAIPGLG
jgi:hypothetical protein